MDDVWDVPRQRHDSMHAERVRRFVCFDGMRASADPGDTELRWAYRVFPAATVALGIGG